MQAYETEFPGLLVLVPRVFQDERGFFLESYNADRFREFGITCDFVQDNHAYSKDAGVLRGLHFQVPPASQAKLVWVTRGAVMDVVVDLRKGSPTYGLAEQVVLSAANFKRLFVPKGFGHGYVSLMPDTEFQYKVDAPYSPEHEGRVGLGRLGHRHRLGVRPAGPGAHSFRQRPAAARAGRFRLSLYLRGLIV